MTSDFNVDDLANDPQFVNGLHNGFSSAIDQDIKMSSESDMDVLNYQIFTRDELDYMSVTVAGRKTGAKHTFGFYSLCPNSIGVSAIRAGLEGLADSGEITEDDKNEIMESVLNVLLDIDSIKNPVDKRVGE